MPEFEALDWYDAPLYYDIIFDVDTTREADFLEGLHKRYVKSRGKRVLEPACGSGRLILEMARRGWQCTGLDLSQPMLDFAKKRFKQTNLKARFLHADMADFCISTRNRADLAFNLVSTFKYLLTEKAAHAHLQCVATALKPGGIYALGFHLSPDAIGKLECEKWQAKRKGVQVNCVIESWPPDFKKRREKVRSRLTIIEKKTKRFLETNWEFRTYNLKQVMSLLKSTPQLEHIATYDFHYDLSEQLPLDERMMDTILILRRLPE